MLNIFSVCKMFEVHTLQNICVKALLHPHIKNDETFPLYHPPGIMEDVLKLFHLKKFQMNTLQNICTSKIISDQIRVPKFAIPVHIFEEMRKLNTVKLLRENEKFLHQKMVILELNLSNAVERFNHYFFLWDPDVVGLSPEAEYYNNLAEKISFHLFDTREKLQQITMEEEFELMGLPDEYNDIQFKLVNQYYDICKEL